VGFPHPNQFPYALAWHAMEEMKFTGFGKNEKQGNENWGRYIELSKAWVDMVFIGFDWCL